jgi:hypothetical protein
MLKSTHNHGVKCLGNLANRHKETENKQLCQFTRNKIIHYISTQEQYNITDMLKHEDYQLLECSAMQSDRNLQTFWSTLLPHLQDMMEAAVSVNFY